MLEKRKQTNIAKFGVEYGFQSTEVKEKIKQTNIAKLGVQYPCQSTVVKHKIKQTNIERRGVEHVLQDPCIKEKGRQTNLERRGVEHAMQNPIVLEKTKQTNLDRYGTENPMQNPEIAERSSKNALHPKQYTFTMGQVVTVQGFEVYALEVLENRGYSHEDLVISRVEVPEIWYMDNHTFTFRRYFVDIYIPKENLMIEVKSTWTYQRNIAKSYWKSCACVDYGYNFEFWVFDSHKTLTILK